jgi:N-acetylmuramoyl-L-alanine amidase
MNLKKTLFFTICIIMLASFFILMISAASNIALNTSLDTVAAKSNPVVIIDSGHGGEDGGAVNDDGVLEKDINLLISRDTADLLMFLGFDTQQTRTDDSDLSDGEDTTRMRKVSDMKKRLEIFNSSENNVIISIHQNKFTQSKYNGTQLFYSPNNEGSSKLAESIKYSVKNLLQPSNERECKQADSGIYLLKNTTNPAVIVECGFISNPEECAKLLDNTYQKQMSFSIVMGFLDYYNS